MADIIYKLADGRMWDVQKAQWVNPVEAQRLITDRNAAIAAANLEQDENAENFDRGISQGGIIDLVSAEGRSDVGYLAQTLAFYDYPLGELVMYSPKGIKEKLQRLDEEYLTPRTLAGLATGDSYAMAQWQEHETKAAPLRQRLAELESE